MADEPGGPLAAFAGYGVEIEYMIVDHEQLDVRPLAKHVLCALTGSSSSGATHGNVGWSNELVEHVLELKNLRPVPTLDGLPPPFQAEVQAVNRLLEPLGAQLMPGGMHPWMDPRRETRLWAHEDAAVYQSYDRIFDCHRHGWANLQSMQLNLSFAGDREFARLHAASRLALPILPALAASSPWADGRPRGYMDYRLVVYRDHQRQLPSSIGDCIPEPSPSPDDYRARVIAPMYRELAAYGSLLGTDTRVLHHEWLDVHAVVPRFSRSAMEIRILDAQECPLADLSIAAATAALIHRIDDAPAAAPMATSRLSAIFENCIRDAEEARISDSRYLGRLGFPGASCRAGELWAWLIDTLTQDGLLAAAWLPSLYFIRDRGTLAHRLAAALAGDPHRLRAVYGTLCQCLRNNHLFPGAT